MRESPMKRPCIVCRAEKEVGITICDAFICEECEQEMVRTDVKDEKYPFFIRQMRGIWMQKNA
ncbi:hypothetical protein BSNK01_10780 [Bacillaceae bacterium]